MIRPWYEHFLFGGSSAKLTYVGLRRDSTLNSRSAEDGPHRHRDLPPGWRWRVLERGLSPLVLKCCGWHIALGGYPLCYLISLPSIRRSGFELLRYPVMKSMEATSSLLYSNAISHDNERLLSRQQLDWIWMWCLSSPWRRVVTCFIWPRLHWSKDTAATLVQHGKMELRWNSMDQEEEERIPRGGATAHPQGNGKTYPVNFNGARSNFSAILTLHSSQGRMYSTYILRIT